MRSNKAVSRFLAGTVFIGGLAFAAQAQAQQQGQPGQTRQERAEGRDEKQDRSKKKVEERVTRLTEQLKLNTNQTTALRTILLDDQTQMEALRAANGVRKTTGASDARGERSERPDSAARAQGKAKTDALRARTDAKIEAMLSGQQRTAFRELVAKRGERAEGGRGGRGDGRDRDGQRQSPPAVK